MKLLAMTAAATLLAAPAMAQDGLTEDQVRSFVADSVEEAQQLVATGDWDGIRSWYEERLSDEAKIAARGTVLIEDGPTMTFSIVMDAEDLDHFGGMSQMPRGAQNPIEDFALTAEVRSVTELPDGGASATVAFSESGVLMMPASAQGSEAGSAATGGSEAESGAERVVFHTSSTCDVRLAPDGGDSITIETIACEAVSTLG